MTPSYREALKILALLGVFAFAMLSLVSGAPYLELGLPGGLPLGNALSALGLCSLAGVPVLLTPSDSVPRTFARGVFFLTTGWLPVSVALAGNLSLYFHGWMGSAWLLFSLLLAVLVGVALVWAVGRLALSAIRSARERTPSAGAP